MQRLDLTKIFLDRNIIHSSSTQTTGEIQMKNIFVLIALLLIGTRITARSQEDVAGGKDHPLFSRMQNFFIEEYLEKEYDASAFIVPSTPKADAFKRVNVEGKRTVIKYHMKEGTNPPVSKLQVVRNYVNAAKKIGGSIVMSGEGKELLNADDGGIYFVWDVTIKFKKSDGETWARLEFDSAVLEPDLSFYLTIVEKTEMKQEIMASSEMLNALNALGRVALYINFDTGKSTVKDESKPIIDEIEKLLKENAALKLSIEGHTDNVGKADANQKLSDDRAKSVMNELVKRGVEKSRLTAKGFGQAKPLEDNSTEKGRAKNRRVELVKVK
jgi:outer membrane protein OmpA-like peptidoglycan-associated protein